MKNKVLISAGHSDTDKGSIANNYKEADLTLELRDLIIKNLKKLNVDCIGDGEEGKNLSLKDAINLIKNSRLAIEIHFNSAGIDKNANGVEIYSLPKYMRFSQRLAHVISIILGSKLRGDKGWKKQEESNRYKLGFVSNGGILIEVEFITNPKAMLKYIENKELLAESIALEIKKYITEGEML